VASPPAYAGAWAVEGCAIAGSGAQAPIDGWTSQPNGAGPYSGASNNCGQSGLVATDSSQAPQVRGTGPMWVFTAPAGATITGGTLDVSLTAPQGVAYVATPQNQYDAADVLINCQFNQPCGTGLVQLNAPVPISHTGGTQLFVAAQCVGPGQPGQPGADCPAGGGVNGVNALIGISQANIELTAATAPQAAAFSGSLLAPNAHGTASLQFTTSEAAPGPGVYNVTVLIDGSKVYSGTPDTNQGKCARVGMDAAGIGEFLYLQPCPLSEAVDLPIATPGLSDGQHQLKVIVTDAAGVTATVLDQAITTANRTTVSALLSGPPTPPLTPVTPPTYAVVLDPPSALLAHGVKRSYQNSALTLSGTLRNAAGVPAPGVVVSLLAKPAANHDAVGTVLATATTNASGAWTLQAPRGLSRQLSIVYGAPPSSAVGSSVAIDEAVRPSLSLNVRTPGRAQLVFTGQLAIAPLPSPRPVVLIEVRGRGGWQAVGVPVHVGPTGRYHYEYPSSPLTVGRAFAFRAATPAVTAQAKAANAVFLAYAPAPAGGAGALCLVDTGVRANPDTQPGLLSTSAIDAGAGSDVDPNGHGTTMAMIAGAAGQGMLGAWPQIKIVSVRATDVPNPGREPTFAFDNYTQAIARCTTLATQYHIHAIDLALSSAIPPSPDQAQGFANRVGVAHGQGVAVVAAAGNSPGPVQEPAVEPGVLAVGAGDANNAICSFSATQSLTFYAPGCGLDEADPFTDQPACCGNGTSQASAFAAAIIVALMSYDPMLTYDKAQQLLVSTATAGHLNVEAAFQADGLSAIVSAGNANIPKPPTPAAPTPAGAGAQSPGKPAAPGLVVNEARWQQGVLTLDVSGLGTARLSVKLEYAHHHPRTVSTRRSRTLIRTGRPRIVLLRVFAGKHRSQGPLTVHVT